MLGGQDRMLTRGEEKEEESERGEGRIGEGHGRETSCSVGRGTQPWSSHKANRELLLTLKAREQLFVLPVQDVLTQFIW